jgi:aminoglycoside N3'-acetyltransferase
LANAKRAKQLNHITNIIQNHHMQEIVPVDNEQELVREYVGGLENNIEYFKEWAAIYQTQRDIARSKVSQLEMKVLQLQEIIRQLQLNK